MRLPSFLSKAVLTEGQTPLQLMHIHHVVQNH